MKDLNQARYWAEGMDKLGDILPGPRAAVEVIKTLPDQWIDAEKLRDVIADWGDREVSPDVHALYQQVLGLIPTLPPRTLADMSLEELKKYIGGEVMVDGWANPTMLVSVIGDEGAVLARRLNRPWPFVEVRPLTDLTPVEATEQEQHNG